ncbi:unnamed protein product, partial [marine sediment metagenome]
IHHLLISYCPITFKTTKRSLNLTRRNTIIGVVGVDIDLPDCVELPVVWSVDPHT